MAEPILLVRTGEFLRPAAPIDGEMLRALPAGKPLKATITQPRRSSPQNRLYRSLLQVVVDNLDQPVTADDLHEWLKMRLGVTAEVRERSGAVRTVTRSVAFDKMEHGEFTQYFDRAKTLICQHLIPGLNSAALERQAREMLGEDFPPLPSQKPAGGAPQGNVGRREAARSREVVG